MDVEAEFMNEMASMSSNQVNKTRKVISPTGTESPQVHVYSRSINQNTCVLTSPEPDRIESQDIIKEKERFLLVSQITCLDFIRQFMTSKEANLEGD